MVVGVVSKRVMPLPACLCIAFLVGEKGEYMLESGVIMHVQQDLSTYFIFGRV